MSTFVKKSKIPETEVGEEGTAKRNILRKGGPGRVRKDGIPGTSVDDGTVNPEASVLDENDPNYDSEDDAGNEYIPKKSPLHSDEPFVKSSITLSSYKKRIESIIVEFFISGDIEATAYYLQDINAPHLSFEFVKRLINRSCDKGDRERELVSQLLSCLCPDPLSSNMIGKGFERLFEISDEIEKDCPSAKSILATFLARCVVDEVLPPSYLADSIICSIGGEVVESAKLMLSREHAGAKLERSWGPGDGRPVEEMKVTVDQVLQEYLLSKDVSEAIRCLAELKSPLFYHEILKRSVSNAMDKPSDERKCMSELLSQLSKNELMSQQQAEKGFNRLYRMLPDLVLDSPSAGAVLNDFLTRAKDDKVVSSNYTYAVHD